MSERELVAGMSVFVAVVDGGSLAAAGRRTGLTPSAVSKLVTRLERGFGTRLLRRTTRRMTVTDSGQVFYDRARAVLEQLRAVEQELASTDAAPRGKLRVSASAQFGQAKVLPILLAFMKKEPGLELELELTDRVVDLVSERVDIAVRVHSSPPASFVARRVGVVQRVLCASPGYLRAAGVPRTAEELSRHSCLHLLGDAGAQEWSFRSNGPGGAPVNVRVSPRIRLSNTAAIHEAARAGLGIADLPDYLVQEDLDARRLALVLPHLRTSPSNVHVIYAPGRLLPTRVREAAGYLEKELKNALS
ncbi:MAG: putative transcriptional regulator, LysR family [Polyangiaceae bacterium]|nr:putative transcriptional regulator, LysR family [Polyangiaceae bacterium]